MSRGGARLGAGRNVIATTQEKQPVPSQLIPWKPGQSGNPKGRTKGSRHRLGEDFLNKLQADFHEHGVAVIAQVREERPHEYLKVLAGILPKQIEIKDDLNEMTDEQLAALHSALDILARSAQPIAIEVKRGAAETTQH